MLSRAIEIGVEHGGENIARPHKAALSTSQVVKCQGVKLFLPKFELNFVTMSYPVVSLIFVCISFVTI